MPELRGSSRDDGGECHVSLLWRGPAGAGSYGLEWVVQLAYRADQPMQGQIPQRLAAASQRPVQAAGESRNVEWPSLKNAGERLPRVGRRPPKKTGSTATRGNRGHCYSVVYQNVVDGFVMILAQTLKHNEVRGTHGEEQLCHDLIGAAQVDQLDVGKIEERGEAVGSSE